MSAGILTFLMMGIAYCLVVPGRPRSYAKAAIAVIVIMFCLARLYLAVDHVDDLLLGVALGVAIPVSAFRFFTPNEVVPGRLPARQHRARRCDRRARRGDPAGRTRPARAHRHRHHAGRAGVLGRVHAVAAAGRGRPADEYLFAKLYTKGHVRADRWYKLWRTILYGSLEDEHPFQTVRRLAEYEDYALRLLQDAGIAVARPYGIVEITPEREYLLVTEFFDGAVEIGDADIDDQVIDQGLQLIRTLWDAGIAHRDIKPGNLMVRSGQLLLIDVAFVQVRPSPWRQAVDLGNMMLVLAVRTDPARVYRRAQDYFTEAELAEAFAATRGVASPTQLRAFIKRDPVTCSPSSARSPRSGARSCCSAGASGGSPWPRRCSPSSRCPPFSASACCCRPPLNFPPPDCGTGHTMILAAQAVPSAAFLPCIAALPSGWTAATARSPAGGPASAGLRPSRATVTSL